MHRDGDRLVIEPGRLHTSIIVVAELRYGCARSDSKRLLKAVEDLLGEIDVAERGVLTELPFAPRGITESQHGTIIATRARAPDL